MKALCESANVNPEKVFPHNLRHLFARTYYSLERDLSRLADILGHSNINTTRIYTAESGAVHARQMERMALIITLFGLCRGQKIEATTEFGYCCCVIRFKCIL